MFTDCENASLDDPGLLWAKVTRDSKVPGARNRSRVGSPCSPLLIRGVALESKPVLGDPASVDKELHTALMGEQPTRL